MPDRISWMRCGFEATHSHGAASSVRCARQHLPKQLAFPSHRLSLHHPSAVTASQSVLACCPQIQMDHNTTLASVRPSFTAAAGCRLGGYKDRCSRMPVPQAAKSLVLLDLYPALLGCWVVRTSHARHPFPCMHATCRSAGTFDHARTHPPKHSMLPHTSL